MLLATPALAKIGNLGNGNGLPPACAATPPAQASALGLTVIHACDTLTSNQAVDVTNTMNPGYDWYISSPVISQNILPAANVSNTSTNLYITQAAAAPTQGLITNGRKLTAPYYTGAVVTGSFYVELDFAFNPITPVSSPSEWPAWWASETLHNLNGVLDATKYPFIELDFMECVPGSIGTNCNTNQQIHIWKKSGSSTVNPCTSASGSALPGGTNRANFNTYGMLHLNASDNGGTGLLKWYVNNQQMQSCSYTSTTMTCSGQLNPFSGTDCVGTELYQMETQAMLFIITAGQSWQVNAKNFHLWQLN